MNPRNSLSSICVGMSIMVMLTTLARAMDSPVQLDVEVSISPPQTITITCQFDPSLTSFNTVDALKIYGPKPNSKKHDFRTLASVDRWDSNPHLFGKLGADAFTIGGSFGFDNGTSELTLSLLLSTKIAGQRFKCAAFGIGEMEERVTVSEIVTLVEREINICHAKNVDPLFDKFDNIAQQSAGLDASLTSLESRLDTIETTVIANSQNISRKMLIDLHTLVQHVTKTMNETFQGFETTTEINQGDITHSLQGLQDVIQSLQQNLTDQASTIRRLEARAVFDVSDEFRGHRYLLSQSEQRFDIQAAEASCESFGGYLVELDDRAEYEFVLQFATGVGGCHYFATGANDIDQEGSFVYYHSHKPVSVDIWNHGEPNNYRGNEDCAALNNHSDGMNDIPCDAQVKFICEAIL